MSAERSERETTAGSPPSGRRQTFEITGDYDRWWASGATRRFAAALGFGREDQARLSVSVAELASNIARHAGRGRIELHELVTPTTGCRVVAVDDGPGIRAIDEALLDGFSEGRWLTPDVAVRERKGLGVGLGTVRRMLDDVRVASVPGGGLVVEAVLFRAPAPHRGTRGRVDRG